MTNTQEQVLVLTRRMAEQDRRISALERIVWEQSSLIQALLELANLSVKKVLDRTLTIVHNEYVERVNIKGYA